MKKSRFTDSQVKSILKQAEAEAEAGTPVAELCHEHGMSTFSISGVHALAVWTSSMMTRLKVLEDENRRLKKMYAEERLPAEIIQEAMAKKW